MSNSSYGAGREQRTSHERYEELVNEHFKEPVVRLFDDVTASVLETLVSNESRSDVEFAVGLSALLVFRIAFCLLASLSLIVVGV